jgi:hypothetical protein
MVLYEKPPRRKREGEVTYYIEADTEADAKEQARMRVLREYNKPVSSGMMKMTRQ